MKSIPAYWCRHPNFGDALTPWLLKKISGREVYYQEPSLEKITYMVTGSILNWNITNAVIWGCGLANRSDTVAADAREIRAVRGPLTAKIARSFGLNVPEVYGDPALLLPRFYDPDVPKTVEVALIPHYVDYPLVRQKVPRTLGNHIHIVDLLGGIEKVIKEIKFCKKAYSSSLHGLIVAHAYGVPCEWVEFSDGVLGDGMKFVDYFLSVGLDPKKKPLNLKSDIDIVSLLGRSVIWKDLKFNFDALFQSAPQF